MGIRIAALVAAGVVVFACGGGSKPQTDAGMPGDGSGSVPDAATGCSTTGLCVEEPFGPRIDYHDVWGAADNAVWVVGTRGAVRFFDGNTWSNRDPEPAGTDLVAIHGTGANDVWAVGTGGAIWHWTGTWTRVESGTTADLFDVSAASPTEAFAVGAEGTVLRWNGTAWAKQTIDVPTTGTVRAVHAPTPGRAFATDALALFEWNGTTWTKHALQQGLYAHEVHVLPDRVLILNAGIGGYYVFQYLNGQFLQIAAGGRASLGSEAYAMRMRAVDDYTVVGPNGTIDQRRTGDSRRNAYHGSHAMRGVWIDSTDRVWAAGDAGTIFRLEPGTDMSSLRTVDAGDLHTMLGVFVRSPTDVWMAGLGGKIVHYDGATWTPIDSKTDVDLYDIAGASDDSIWVAGDHGTVIHLANGTATLRPLSRDVTLSAIVPDGAGGAWVAGQVFEHWDGNGWIVVENLFDYATDAWSPAAGDIWLAHTNGRITRYTNGVEQAVPRATPDDLYAIWGTSPSDVYAGGYASSTYHYDGAAWTEEANEHQSTPGGYYGVWGTSADDVVMVGDHVLLRRAGAWVDAELDGYSLRRVHGVGTELWAVGWNQSFVHRE